MYIRPMEPHSNPNDVTVADIDDYFSVVNPVRPKIVLRTAHKHMKDANECSKLTESGETETGETSTSCLTLQSETNSAKDVYVPHYNRYVMVLRCKQTGYSVI